MIVPYFSEHFTEEDSGNLVNEVDNFLTYVERTYLGKKNRQGYRGAPLFLIRMWNICERVLNGKDITSNSVESWNSRWNNTLGTNKSLYSVINAFKNEDALARVKFRQVIAGRTSDPNPSRKDRKEARLNRLKDAISNFKVDVKDYMFMLRNNL